MLQHNEMIALMAASLLGGNSDNNTPFATNSILGYEISSAVKIAQKIWDETLRQERQEPL